MPLKIIVDTKEYYNLASKRVRSEDGYNTKSRKFKNNIRIFQFLKRIIKQYLS
jgi:hypothetical protein